MASTPTPRPIKVFIDSTVLFSASYSSTGAARAVLLAGLTPAARLFISPLVLKETRRNLEKKAPAALPAFDLLSPIVSTNLVDPPLELVLEAANVVNIKDAPNVVNIKDAPIVAGALHAQAHYLATFDRIHLVNFAPQILANWGLVTTTPDVVIEQIRTLVPRDQLLLVAQSLPHFLLCNQ
jgi:predicted nucleic acid-binding protein